MRTIKVVIVGPSGVGKTSLRYQYISKQFTTSYRATIGADFIAKNVTLPNGEVVGLHLWDTAGQERFSSLSNAFLRGADAAIVVYDATKPPEEIEQDVKKWMNIVRDGVGTSASHSRAADARSRYHGGRWHRFNADQEDEWDDESFCWAVVGNKMDKVDEDGREGLEGRLRGLLGTLQGLESEAVEDNYAPGPSTTGERAMPNGAEGVRDPLSHYASSSSSRSTHTARQRDGSSTYSSSLTSHTQDPSETQVAASSQPLSLPQATNSTHVPHTSLTSHPSRSSTTTSLSKSSKFQYGTMTTTHTTFTIYHTPAGSHFSPSSSSSSLRRGSSSPETSTSPPERGIQLSPRLSRSHSASSLHDPDVSGGGSQRRKRRRRRTSTGLDPDSSFSSISSDGDSTDTGTDGWVSARESMVFSDFGDSNELYLNRPSPNGKPVRPASSRSTSGETIRPSQLRDTSASSSSQRRSHTNPTSSPSGLNPPHSHPIPQPTPDHLPNHTPSPFFFTSAKTSVNVPEVFAYVALATVQKAERQEREMMFYDTSFSDTRDGGAGSRGRGGGSGGAGGMVRLGWRVNLGASSLHEGRCC